MQVKIEREKPTPGGLRLFRRATIVITNSSELSALKLALTDRLKRIGLWAEADPGYWMPHVNRIKSMMASLEEAER